MAWIFWEQTVAALPPSGINGVDILGSISCWPPLRNKWRGHFGINSINWTTNKFYCGKKKPLSSGVTKKRFAFVLAVFFPRPPKNTPTLFNRGKKNPPRFSTVAKKNPHAFQLWQKKTPTLFNCGKKKPPDFGGFFSFSTVAEKNPHGGFFLPQ